MVWENTWKYGLTNSTATMTVSCHLVSAHSVIACLLSRWKLLTKIFTGCIFTILYSWKLCFKCRGGRWKLPMVEKVRFVFHGFRHSRNTQHWQLQSLMTVVIDVVRQWWCIPNPFLLIIYNLQNYKAQIQLISIILERFDSINLDFILGN